MNDIERYEFDRLGYLVIPNLLTAKEVKVLAEAVDALEEHAVERVGHGPRKISPWNKMEYHRNEDRGYHVTGQRAEGATLIIEDFWNADSAFDLLVNHSKTMEFIRDIILEEPTINNSEIRIRYPRNATFTHMGGPIGHKYRYVFSQGKIDCMMVRMIYFLHDVAPHEGVFSVVPGTHKSNYNTPYGNVAPDDEPGMIGLTAKAGDGILFTEHLRHAGLVNRSDKTRKTLHVGYGPPWMMSQNIATGDEPPYLKPSTRKRFDEAQNRLFAHSAHA